MAININQANASAQIIAQDLKSVSTTLDQAKLGTAQAASIADVKQQLENNKDGLVESVGQGNFDALLNTITLLNADTRDGAAEVGGNASQFQADFGNFVDQLNSAGMQVNVEAGQGHYDASAAIANAGGNNITAGQAASTIAANANALMGAYSDMNAAEPDSEAYVAAFNNAQNNSADMLNATLNWAQGSNMNAAQKTTFEQAHAAASDAFAAFTQNPGAGNQFTAAFTKLTQAMQSVGYAGPAMTF